MLISRNPAGVVADSSSLYPTISSDGRVVVFSSFSRDITPTASPIGIYVWTAVNGVPGDVADLSLAVTAAPVTVDSGHEVIYTIAVANTGVVEATDVGVDVAIPAHVHFVGASRLRARVSRLRRELRESSRAPLV